MDLTLTVCLIIKNEEKHLARCLASIRDIAGEIIIVDTGSTDHSVRIANEFTGQVYFYQWKDDFSAARNYCLDKANGEWILFLDGDEELDESCRQLLQDKLQVPEREAYLLMVNHDASNSHELLAMPDLQPRLFRSNRNYRYRGIIDEKILPSILDSNLPDRIEIARDISITHYGYSNAEPENRHRLKRNTDLVNKWLEAEEDHNLRHFYLGREYYRHHQFTEALAYFLLIDHKADLRPNQFKELLRCITVSLYMLDRIPEALDFIEEALNGNEDRGDLQYLKAVNLKKIYRYAEAYEAFQECLRVTTPGFHEANVYCQHKYRIYFYLGGLAEYFMDKEKALFYYFESLKEDPYKLDPLRRMIAILNPKMNPEYTINSLNQVFDLSDLTVQTEIAFIFYEEAAYQLALQVINYLEARGPISEKIRLLKGMCLLRSKQYSEAEEELQGINSNKNLYITARQYLLFYYWMNRDYRKAAGCLKRINNAGADPAISDVLNLLTRGKSIQSGSTLSKQYALAKEIMELLVELGERQQVNEAYQNLAPLLGERPSYLLAELYYKHEKHELVEEELGCLLATDNIDARAYYYLGKTCWGRGDLITAAQYLHEAVAKGLDTPKIRMETARLYQEQVIAALRECSRLCPVSKHQGELIQELENSLLEI